MQTSSARILATITVVLALLGAVAHAQPKGGIVPPAPAGQVHAAPLPPPPTEAAPVSPDHHVAGTSTAATDVDTGSGTGMALLFWAFAAASVLGSLFVITRRNLIAAVMGMVGTFFGVAVLYMMLYASFLAIIQMLVYAGAIMVLFVFVVMVLNKPEDEAVGKVGLPGRGLALVAMGYLVLRLVLLVWSVTPQNAKGPDAAMKAPDVVHVTYKAPARAGEPADQAGMTNRVDEYDFGSTAAVGNDLFNAYVFPFEAISVLLLIAVVGAIAIARPLKDETAGDAAAPGGAP